ncbi:CRTAC1 family protein [Bdellovibrio bacteriovorus]|uniref:Rhs family protein n=1 Tax=Bdellovibrio bacteriovorus (strain ATCC 15356 / DSM 50701 / NCIMB 9529 / HD100) TaxID=264462 RepID=Q6MQX4_BDEBA|nr:CRTAC1 family protein [Bdellovibrio bacteriovorus]CAE77984.1 rhs family protein [Bdellovibrio bacteriovorus HD100]
MNRTFFCAAVIAVCFLLGFKVANPEGAPRAGKEDLSSTASQFQDVTGATGIPKVHSGTIVFGDYDGDGWVDMLAAGRLFRNVSNSSNIRFTDVTDSVGIVDLKGAPLFVDIDNNGLLDILTTKGQAFVQVSAGRFVESSKALRFALPDHAHDMAIVDVNKDGLMDVLVGFAEPKFGDPLLPAKMYLNIKGKHFLEANPSMFAQNPNYLRGIAVADYDNNGQTDAYFSNYRLRPNNFYTLNPTIMVDKAPLLNVQGAYDPKKFYDSSRKEYYGPRYGHTIASIWADLDNDGNLDLWVSNLVHKFVGMTPKGTFDQRGYLCDDSKIYRNTGHPSYRLIDVRAESGIPYRPIGDFSKYKGDELWAQTTAADFDNDGLLDVYISQVYDLAYSYSVLYKNTGKFKFQDVSAVHGTRVFDSYAAAWADLNNDGKMDLVQSGRAKNKEAPAIRVLQNVMGDGNNYLRVQIKGTRSGTQAVAAQVRVYHSGGVFLRQVDGVTGTMNQQNDPTLHFGLGSVKNISKVEVRWPSGKVQVLDNVSVNSTLKIEEPR